MPSANWAILVKDIELENKTLKNVLQYHDAETTRLKKELREARASVDRLRKGLNAALMREDDLIMNMEEAANALPKMATVKTRGVAYGMHGLLQHMVQALTSCKNSLHANLSISTDTDAIQPDRSLVRQSNAPLRNINEDDSRPPEEYRGRRRTSEYRELLSRGATRLMCETFHLEFTDEEGIYAWADWEIYHDFAVPHMQEGDFWKIHLGRRIELDEEDLDGSMFIEDLLEAALMFPALSSTCNQTYDKWETIEESPGIWLTRLQDPEEDVSDEVDQEDDVLSLDDSSDDECQSCVSASDEDMQLESPSGSDVQVLNVYSSGDDMDSEGEETLSDDDDFASHDSISDSSEGEVYDTAFLGFTEPDGMWASDMDDSEDGEYTPKAEDDEPQLGS